MTDTHISVRLKHGIHTIYLFVDFQDSVRAVSNQLRTILRERYPRGLTTSLESFDKTPLPDEDDDVRIAYAVLNVPSDPARGWKRLKTDDDENITASRAGFKDNGIVAFTFVAADEEDDEPIFQVEWPREDEEGFE